MIDEENPFSQSVPSSMDPDTLKEDVRGNLELTALIVKICSVVCMLFVFPTAFFWVKGFDYLTPLEMGWTWSHIIHPFRITFVVSFALLGWKGWIYGNFINKIPVGESTEFAKYVESQTWMWLAIGLLVFLFLVATALTLTASYSRANESRFEFAFHEASHSGTTDGKAMRVSLNPNFRAVTGPEV